MAFATPPEHLVTWSSSQKKSLLFCGWNCTPLVGFIESVNSYDLLDILFLFQFVLYLYILLCENCKFLFCEFCMIREYLHFAAMQVLMIFNYKTKFITFNFQWEITFLRLLTKKTVIFTYIYDTWKLSKTLMCMHPNYFCPRL